MDSGKGGAYPDSPPPFDAAADHPGPPPGYQPNYGGPAPPANANYAAYSNPPTQPNVVIVADNSRDQVTRSKHPVNMECPHCHAQIKTKVQKETGMISWLIFFAFFVVGFFTLIGWCISPCIFCIDDMQDAVHTCPNCHTHIGTRKPFGMV